MLSSRAHIHCSAYLAWLTVMVWWCVYLADIVKLLQVLPPIPVRFISRTQFVSILTVGRLHTHVHSSL
jgi:hypothetical protein